MFRSSVYACATNQEPRTEENARKKSTEEVEEIANADILKAVVEVSNWFTTLERNMSENTEASTMLFEQLKGVDIRVKANEKKWTTPVRGCCKYRKNALMLNTMVDDGTCVCMVWKRKHQKENHHLTLMSPEDKEKMDILVNTFHRVGTPRNNATCHSETRSANYFGIVVFWKSFLFL